ncbi:MAG: hypothetical protein AAF270_14775 [Pseudomonadota bacterium]
MSNRVAVRSFAYHYSVLLLVLVILGFGSRALFLPECWPPVRVTLVLHIIVMAAWFLLVVGQALPINKRSISMHKFIGQFGQIVA